MIRCTVDLLCSAERPLSGWTLTLLKGPLTHYRLFPYFWRRCGELKVVGYTCTLRP